ncbi:VCBS protein, partial [Candidatus Magnetomorum sp. HK-1]
LNVHRVNCYIGKSNWNDKLFAGMMDDLRIWNVARTQDQILNNKERPLIGNEYGLIGYWSMNDYRYKVTDFARGLNGVYTNRMNYYKTEETSFPKLKHVHISAKNNAYIEIPHRKVLNSDSELTLETWVKPIQSGNNIIAGKFNDALNRGYLLKVNSSMEVIAEVWDNAGTAHTLNIGSLSVSNWSHIAVTWMKNGKLTGYIDGVQTAQIDASQELLSMTADPFYISYS